MTGPYKKSKYLAERVADEFAAAGHPIVIVNPSAPVGDADVKPTATGQMIVDFLSGRMAATVDTGLNLIDVRDCAIGHLLAAEKGRVGEKLHPGQREPDAGGDPGDLLSAITGRRARRGCGFPTGCRSPVAAVDTWRARLFGGEPRVALDAVRLSRYRMFFDSGKAVRELGLPQTPVDGALRRAVDWFRAHGYVDATGRLMRAPTAEPHRHERHRRRARGHARGGGPAAQTCSHRRTARGSIRSR